MSFVKFEVTVGGCEKSRLFSVLALKRAGFSLADVQSDVLLPPVCT